MAIGICSTAEVRHACSFRCTGCCDYFVTAMQECGMANKLFFSSDQSLVVNKVCCRQLSNVGQRGKLIGHEWCVQSNQEQKTAEMQLTAQSSETKSNEFTIADETFQERFTDHSSSYAFDVCNELCSASAATREHTIFSFQPDVMLYCQTEILFCRLCPAAPSKNFLPLNLK